MGRQTPKNDPLEGILIHGNNDAYRIGYKDAIDKACKWLNESMEDCTRSYEDYDVHDVVASDYSFKKEFIEAFIKYMEEQQ